MNAAAIRGDWVGNTIDGRFPLREWLGGSSNSGVFLTELEGPESQRAAIKLIPIAVDEANARIAAWAATEPLSHPHLVRILHYGRAQIGGTLVAYVVTEYAEEILSQIIPARPLTPEETREMLAPVLDVLSFLHAKGFVHAHLKPSNLLVVDNQLKLSADGLLVAGKERKQPPAQPVYDPPESGIAAAEPPSDMWSLGVTLAETLTQHPPTWDRTSDHEPVVPESIPQPFAGIARGCLRLEPARRFTTNDVRVLLSGSTPPVEPGPSLHLPPHAARKTGPSRIPVIPLVIIFLVLIAIIAAMSLRSHKDPSPSGMQQQQAAPSASPSPDAGASSQGFSKGAVLNRDLPSVPRQAEGTIHGTVQVVVVVNVDATGHVADAHLASPGPSKYFGRLALDSAHSWKFKPAELNGHAVPSVWVLRYQFRRGTTEVTPTEQSP